ncbi:MAG: proprotein convertase P-domain-containing protein, partial [Psychroserpens sp.]|nr:proprotein convertase P-domain-containing protein [Psychroserpens sp.]
MKKFLGMASVLLFLCISLSSFSQNNIWETTEFRNGTDGISLEKLDPDHYKVFQLNIESLKQELQNAPHRNSSNEQSNTIVKFPNVEGRLESYRIMETAIFSTEEGAQMYPNIKTYLGSRTDNSGTRIRFSVTPLGLKAMISEPGKENYYIQPITKVSNGQYFVYRRSTKQTNDYAFECLTDELETLSKSEGPSANRDANDQVLRTYRIAISTTSGYTGFWNDGNNANGGPQEDALAEMISTLNRTNEVFEVDMAISFLLVNTADDPAIDLIYFGTDPYGFNLNADLQANLTAVVGEEDYDIGHVFDFGGGGNAGCIGCVCEDGQKGSAFSAHPFTDNDGGPYQSDFFDIDYVPHEIGHQMGANHTWSFNSEGTGVNAEPGSGTSIMGYAGITGPNDVQDHSDPYFHFFSITQILNNVGSAPNNCSVNTNITNNPPVAEAGPDYTIPRGTAFVLRGNATDPDGGDVLTYCWEQVDNGVTTSANFGPNKTTGAVWRSRPPSTSPNRFMPFFERVLDGQLTETNPVETVDNSSWETVSNVQRDLNFGLTVRDRSEAGGVGQTPQSSFDTMAVTVDGSSGPFVVTSQSTNETWDAGSNQIVTWNVAGTDGGNVNTPTVNILLSIDGGQSFPFTLASNVPNDGSQVITVPLTGGDTNNARIIVEGNNNIFYAVNSSEFSIQESEFVVTFDNDQLDVCQPDNTVFNFTYNTFLGFTSTTNFSVTGLPAGLTAVINPSSASADNTAGTVTISGTQNVSTGSYPFTFQAVSGALSSTVDLQLNIFNDTISPVTLNMPGDGAIDVSAEVEFMWDALANAQDYLIEIATDAGFTNIIDSATVQAASYVSDALGADTLYFWRVTGSNLCGSGNASSTFSFTTVNLTCDTFIDDVPQNISPVGAGNSYTSTITVDADFPITDVNVTLNIQHTWVSDLEITLTSPEGTVVDLIFDEGGDGDNLVNTTFDQEGTDGPIEDASAPFTGSFLPEGDLSTIYGETSGGDWVLTIVDDANFDGGVFHSFELFLCVQGSLSIEEDTFTSTGVKIYPNPNEGTF